jgi:hypothetical protein
MPVFALLCNATSDNSIQTTIQNATTPFLNLSPKMQCSTKESNNTQHTSNDPKPDLRPASSTSKRPRRSKARARRSLIREPTRALGRHKRRRQRSRDCRQYTRWRLSRNKLDTRRRRWGGRASLDGHWGRGRCGGDELDLRHSDEVGDGGCCLASFLGDG